MGGSTSSQAAQSEEEEKPFSVSNLGDSASLKRCVDEAAASAVIDQGYDEDHFHSNVRIGLGLVACVFALAAQFWPGTFPDNSNVLIACVVGYIVFSIILNTYSATYEGDVILFTTPKEGSSFSTGLAMTTLLKRYSDELTIEIRSKDPKARRKAVEKTYSVCRWFDVNGIMAKDKLEADVLKLLRMYESGESESKKSK
eukprot:jgi/Tetstr1/458877/TSEL_004385.t1